MVAEELLPEVVQMRLGLLAGARVRLGHVDVAQHVTVLGAGRPSMLRGERAIPVEDRARARVGTRRRAASSSPSSLSAGRMMGGCGCWSGRGQIETRS